MFAPAFAPFANPEAIVNSKLALAFLAAGWDVAIITRNLAEESSYNYGSGWVSPWNSLREHTHSISYPRNTRLHRLVDTTTSMLKTQYFTHGGRWAWHAYQLAKAFHAGKPFDVILSRALPDSAHLPAKLFARSSGLPWIANWNDASGAKNLPPYGVGLSGKLGFFEKRLVNTVARTADVMTFPSDRLRRYICQYLPEGSADKSETIPHAALHYKHQPPTLHDTFTLCHAGHLSIQRNSHTFIEGFAMFVHDSAEKPATIFRIIGIQDEDVMGIAKKYGIAEYVDCIGSLSYEETLSRLYQSDVSVIIEAALPEGVYLPAKFVDYVQVGHPILAVMPAEGEVNDILSANGGGITVDCTSPQDIAEAMKKLYKYWLQGNLNHAFSSDRLYSHFAPEKIASNYARLFSKLIKEQ